MADPIRFAWASSCVCNDGQWEQCVDKQPVYNPSPVRTSSPWNPSSVYVPPACYDGAVEVDGGSRYTLRDGRTCTCQQGQWMQCEKPYVPVYVPKSCQDFPATIPHGTYYKRKNGEECECNDGVWKDCTYNPPPYQGCDAEKAQIMFLFDTSKSITEESDGSSDAATGKVNWRAMAEFVSFIVEELPISPSKNRIGISSFADSPSIQIRLDSSTSTRKDEILETLEDWAPKLTGNTFLGKALEFVDDRYLRDFDGKSVLVVLTDGGADDEDRMRTISREMRNSGVVIIAVGVGEQIEEDQLLVLTGGNENRVLTVQSFAGLKDNFRFLTDNLCSSGRYYYGN